MPTLTSVTKHFITSQEGFTTTTAGSVASGAATVTLNSVSGYTNGDQVAFVIDPTDVTKKQVFTGTIDTSGVQVTNVVWTEGTNQTHAAGATVVDYTTATHQAAMVKGVKVSLDDDGTLKAGAVDNSAVFGAGVIPTTAYADASVTSEKLNATVGFYATTAQSVATGVETAITTYTEVDDLGGDFNPATGVFTAPYDGFYHFETSMGVENITSTTDGRVICRLYLNGTVIAEGFNDGQTTSSDVISQVAISMSLTAADEVQVAVTNLTSGTETLYRSFFSGFLVGRT